MVKLNKIYTKTGDDGSTGLSDGSRRPKSDLRVESYGTVDEANSVMGLLIDSLQATKDQQILIDILTAIQHDMFDLGADIAKPFGDDTAHDLRIVAHQVKLLEQKIDSLNETLPPLESFILPGGGKAASICHMARTTTRRAERLLVGLKTVEEINPLALQYLNRLSDLLFVMARLLARAEKGEVLWQPGKNRS